MGYRCRPNENKKLFVDRRRYTQWLYRLIPTERVGERRKVFQALEEIRYGKDYDKHADHLHRQVTYRHHAPRATLLGNLIFTPNQYTAIMA